MATTARRALRKPVLTDNPDVPRDIGNLADDIDAMMAALITGTTANRATYTAGPPGPKDGDIYWVTDDLTMGAFGTPYKWDSANSAWRIFGPASPAPQSAINSKLLGPGVGAVQRAGRTLTLYDYQTVLGLTTPPGLFNLSDTSNLGSGGAINNKGAVPFGVGIQGAAASCAVFAGSGSQGLYVDGGAAGSYSLRGGSVFGWHRSARSGNQAIVSKMTAAGGAGSSCYYVGSTGRAFASVSIDGATSKGVAGQSNINDDRWHYVGFTFDGAVLRLWVDGVCEGTLDVAGPIFVGAVPLTIGALGADSVTTGINPHYGRIDEVLITNDVLNEDQIRLLYCAKFPHTYGAIPTRLRLQIIRQQRGGPLVTGDFPSVPLRLYNFTAGTLTDDGSQNTALTNNNASVSVAGGDGTPNGAFLFNGTNQFLSATDTGLPIGASARTIMCWFKSTGGSIGTVAGMIAYGTLDDVMLYDNRGKIFAFDGLNSAQSPGTYDDGQIHHAAAVFDNSASDGAKIKLYIDGRCVSTNQNLRITGAVVGAGGFKIGKSSDPTNPYFNGIIDGVAVLQVALTGDQVYSVFAKGSKALAASVKHAGEHIEGQDTNFLLGVFDTIEPQHIVQMEVAA
jgi:hypothetical protein